MTNQDLVHKLIAEGTLKSPEIIQAFETIDRIGFVPDDLQEKAYVDHPLEIGERQTISQPTTVAFMLELLKSKKGDKVLEIGAGSGWLTMLLSRLVGDKGFIKAYEINPKVGQFGLDNLSRYNPANVELIIGDAKVGWEGYSYDKIVASAAFLEIPEGLASSLKEGGILVTPTQRNDLVRVSRVGSKLIRETFPGFTFVPIQEYH